VRLLSGNAPEAVTELLAYDCRLMNRSHEEWRRACAAQLAYASDQWLSPQAAVLSPQAAWVSRK
jgi:hypothetical protein